MVNVSSNHSKSTQRASSLRKSSIVSEPVLPLDSDAVILRGDDENSIATPFVPLIGKFAYLRFANNQLIIFNINCQSKHLLDYFQRKYKETAEISVNQDNIDVADLSGNLKSLCDKLNINKLASELLAPRETYILCDTKRVDGRVSSVVPLLVNSDLLTSSFLVKLTPKQPKVTKSNHSSNSNSSSGAQHTLVKSGTGSFSNSLNKLMNTSLTEMSDVSGSSNKNEQPLMSQKASSPKAARLSKIKETL